jgi:parallel beta-helix repeat protein
VYINRGGEMPKMKKALTLLIILTLLPILLEGCLEEKPVEETYKEKTPGVFYVDDDGEANYTRIQDAIDHAENGSTIFVNDGTYYEILTINKTISLIGAGRDKTVIDRGKNGAYAPTVFINADNCTIKGFKVTKSTISFTVTGIHINSSNNTVSNNTISDHSEGIHVEEGTYNNISGNNILNSRDGIRLETSSRNTISGNNISSNSQNGIFLKSKSNYNIISGNILFKNGLSISIGTGIRIKGSEYNEVFDNAIVNNQRGVHCCCGAHYNTIYNNLFKDNNDNARDDIARYGRNRWYDDSKGNYWSDYMVKYPDANRRDGIWDTPYDISGHGESQDKYPLVEPPVSFFMSKGKGSSAS